MKALASEAWQENKDEEFDFEMDGDYFKDGFRIGYEQAYKTLIKDLKFALSWACVLHNDESKAKKKLDRLHEKYKDER